MQRSAEGETELFFDSVDCLPTEESIAEKSLGRDGFGYEIWLDQLQSVRERREIFLRGMGLVDVFSCRSDEIIGSGRIAECIASVSSSSDVCSSGEVGHAVCCSREMNSEANSMVDEEQDQLDQPRLAFVSEEFGHSLCMEECIDTVVEERRSSGAGNKKMKRWWKQFLNKRKGEKEKCAPDTIRLDPQELKANRMKVKQNNKRCLEFTGVYMGQEIQAHNGFIWTMKFSPAGRYLATGGEDGVVRIWLVTSVDASCKSFPSEDSCGSSKKEGRMSFRTKKTRNASVIFPEKVFHIQEFPVHEFHGHGGDVLDLAWSNSNCLLSSSKDKTVRLWQVGHDYCLNVFHHSNYVTCIQFNPVNENCFISGSIDGKVRIWGVSEERVVDWVDARDVISAVCYQPDGKGFAVGSIGGTCRFYEVSGNDIQLEAEIHIQNRKKTSGNRITGIQFSQERCRRVMITSEDSKVRIFDGVDIIHKFKGLPKSGSQMSASFTSNGRHIISVGEDCRVYVWNYDGFCTPSSKHIKSVRSCEHFFSEGASIAVPWSGNIGSEHGGISSSNNNTPRNQMRNEEGASWRRDSDRFSLGNWFFTDSSRRGGCTAATWPEEILPLWDEATGEYENRNQQQEGIEREQQFINSNEQIALSDAWALAIVTGGWDGTIRTFQNYGLPMRM